MLEGASGFTRWSLNMIGGLSSSNITMPDCSFWSCPAGDIIIETQDCAVLGVDACFNLNNYNSLPIGEVTEVDGERFLTDSSEGLFLSFQTQDMTWLDSPGNQNPTASDFIQTYSGAFLNVPNAAITVNLGDAINGIDRGQNRVYWTEASAFFSVGNSTNQAPACRLGINSHIQALLNLAPYMCTLNRL